MNKSKWRDIPQKTLGSLCECKTIKSHFFAQTKKWWDLHKHRIPKAPEKLQTLHDCIGLSNKLTYNSSSLRYMIVQDIYEDGVCGYEQLTKSWLQWNWLEESYNTHIWSCAWEYHPTPWEYGIIKLHYGHGFHKGSFHTVSPNNRLQVPTSATSQENKPWKHNQNGYTVIFFLNFGYIQTIVSTMARI